MTRNQNESGHGGDDRSINIRGKQYLPVSARVADFRSKFPIDQGWGILTEVVENTENRVVMKAAVCRYFHTTEHEAPYRMIVTAVGFAEEFRAANQINKTSAMENCETSAIGRALANAGFGGSEYASANEVQNAIHQQQNPPKTEVSSQRKTPEIPKSKPKAKPESEKESVTEAMANQNPTETQPENPLSLDEPSFGSNEDDAQGSEAPWGGPSEVETPEQQAARLTAEAEQAGLAKPENEPDRPKELMHKVRKWGQMDPPLFKQVWPLFKKVLAKQCAFQNFTKGNVELAHAWVDEQMEQGKDFLLYCTDEIKEIAVQYVPQG